MQTAGTDVLPLANTIHDTKTLPKACLDFND